MKIAIAIVLMAAVAPAGAADLPLLSSKRLQLQERQAVRNLERHKRMTRKQFENMLMSPIGRGRLE